MAIRIWAILCGVLAIGCAGISVMQLLEKGFLFHNAYIWASKQQRETMDKQPYYRQSGVAFALCGGVFLSMGLECLLGTGWLWLLVGALSIGLLVYAIKSA